MQSSQRLNRRQFMALGIVAGGAVQVALPFTGLIRPGRAKAAPGKTRATATVPPFSVRMPVPAELRPVGRGPDTDHFRLTLQHADVEIIPGLRTPVMTFGGQYVGPTIRARSGRRALVRYTNRLDMAANAHLHGGHVPAASDGHPMSLIQPGRTQLYEYPNTQPGATLWYHDHTHMMENVHVYRGMHGFYLIEDEDERRLRLPSGAHDVPIMISEAHIMDDGTLFYDPQDTDRTILANGRPVPYFPVAARKYRFRLLNASTSLTLELDLGGVTMTQIGSDGGLLPAPEHRTSMLITPGERVEIVVDFSSRAIGDRLVLADAHRGPVLRFDVTRPAVDTSRVPDVLRPIAPLARTVTEREFVLSVDPNVFTGLINGKPFDPNRVDVRVKRGTSEIWRIVNADRPDGPLGGVHHNFHSHLTQFRVLDRDGAPPLPGESGLKDTVRVDAGKSVRVQATFRDFVGKYVYHCHILEHSSMGMMGQMEVVP